jgi:uncharacterized membrane protein YczE
MMRITRRLLQLYSGLFLYALGIVVTMKANIGYAPWEVFHAGLATILSSQIGTMTILVGIILVSITAIFGEQVGLGTISNMIFVGVFMNILLASGLFSDRTTMVFGVVQHIAGLFIIALASWLYIKSGFGAGPRDSLMVLLSRKTGFPIGVCRAAIEASVTFIGFALGGMMGWGTLLSAVMVGLCIQLTFRLLRFDATSVVHEDLFTTLRVKKSTTSQ